MGGEVDGRQVFFLPRHGRGHRLLPHELNHRANIYALRSLGVRWIICVTAVGSLQEQYAPRDVVLPSQFYDRTSRRAEHTFFGGGIAAHIAFAEPICTPLRDLLAEAAPIVRLRVHNGGTYVNMDGPAFSTRAESELNRRHGFDVIGMTNLPEAKLAREAEIALATMAMITDYDCWKIEEEPVSAQTVIAHLLANAETAKKLLADVIPRIPRGRTGRNIARSIRPWSPTESSGRQRPEKNCSAILGRFEYSRLVSRSETCTVDARPIKRFLAGSNGI